MLTLLHIYFMLMVVSALSGNGTDGCSCEQNPTWQDTNGESKLNVTCTVGLGPFDCIDKIPKNVTHLIIVLEFCYGEDTNTSFSSFEQLELLVIVTPIFDTFPFICTLGEDTFGNLTHLKLLRINLPTEEIPPKILLGLESLEELDLSHIGYFSSQKLAALYNGSKLQEKPLKILRANRMSDLSTFHDKVLLMKDIMTLPNISSLKELDVSNNKELYMYPGLTQYLPNLEVINIEGNRLKYIDSETDVGCSFIELFMHRNIRSISIRGIDRISEESFELSFSSSLINCTRSKPNKHGSCLCEEFKLFCSAYFPAGVNCSEIYTVEKCGHDVCFQQNNLQNLDVSHTSLYFPFLFASISGFNKVIEFNCAFSEWGSVRMFPHLEVLNVTGNSVNFNVDGYPLLKLLKQLYLSQISEWPHEIDLKPLQHQHNLEHLDLSSNELTSFDFYMKPLTKLRYLDLSNNWFTQLSSETMDAFDWLNSIQLKKPKGKLQIDMRNNMFVCDCYSMRFLYWIKSTHIAFINFSTYTCAYKPLSTMPIANVKMGEQFRHCYQTIIVGTSLSAISLMVFITSCLVYRYRWKVRLCLLKVSHINTRDNLKDFKYDAFVVYTDQDRAWVHNTLLEELENQRKLKLCIHHRDFIPGHDIDAQIVRSVDSSRKTLLVLSRHFLESSWCQYEMNVARNKLQAEGKDVVLPVLLAELSPEELNKNPPIKNLLREKTYLRWETSIDGQKYFWEKLTLGLQSSVERKRKHDNDNVNASVSVESPLINDVETPSYGTQTQNV